MFDSISWTDFILSLSLGAAVYYAAILFLYFSADLKRLLTSAKNDTTEISSIEEATVNKNLMGEARSTHSKQEATASHVEESTQIISKTADIDHERSWSTDEFVTQPLHRSFSQLLEEINALAYIIAQNSKEEISLLFETLLSRYPQLAKPHHQSSINQFIIEACHQYGELTLTHQDIDAWWTQALGNSSRTK